MPAFAQFTEDFEPVVGQTGSTRDKLISQNWILPDMDINVEGTTPINGQQSLGSGPTYKPTQSTGIVTPYLTFGNSENLEFNYNIHRAVMSVCRRWFLVSLIDNSNNVTLIDSVEVDGTSTSVVHYNKAINGYTGTYSIYINFRGDGCNGKFVVDDFRFSGNNANIGSPAHLGAQGTAMGINDETANKNDISLYPNPAFNNVNVNVAVTNSQKGEIEITNISGAKLQAEQVQLNNGENTIAMNISNLPSGTYYLTVKTEEGTFTKRFSRIQ